MITSVLQLHKGPSLQNLRISLYVNKAAKHAVHKWLEFVFSKQVERLELDFQCREEEDLVVLELEEVLREKSSSLCRRPQTDVILSKSLKRLCLKYINVSGEDIKLFLCSCPLLEELIIGFAFLRSDVEKCGASLILKRLEIYCCTGDKSIKVSSPNLTWFRVEDTSEKLLLENVPKLFEADFRIRSGRPHVVQSFASQVFSHISSQLKFLNLTLHSPKVFLANGIPEMPMLKKLVFGYYGEITHSFLTVTDLIWASPRLEEFKVEFGNMCAFMEVKLIVERSSSPSPHQHLKVFELARFPWGHEDLVDELVTYITNNCTAFEKIIFGRSSWFQYSGKLCDYRPATNYVEQRLQGKLPQHIQLQLL